MSTRETTVSGQFYPDSSRQIKLFLEKFNKRLEQYLEENPAVKELKSRSVIVPHAGYIYSGYTANMAYRLLDHEHLKTIVVIGPSHRIGFKGTSISMYDYFDTPLGTLKIDKELAADLQQRFGLSFVPQAHHEHSTEVQMPMIKNYIQDVFVLELIYSDEDPQDLAKVITYLHEDPHTAVVISSDLSHFYNIHKANRLDKLCMDAVLNNNIEQLHKGCEACGKIGIEAMMLAAKALALKPHLLDYRTSADTSGDESSVVGYMSIAFTEDDKKEQKGDVLLKLARASIAKTVGVASEVNVDDLVSQHSWLKEKGAVFVTLNKKNDQLRGCIGSLEAHRKLYDDVLHNAKSAAVEDPRFQPLSKDEFKDVKVEVSLLTPPVALAYNSVEELREKVKKGLDGVILKHGKYKATFLPQVWDQLPTFDMFFSHLCQKAGLHEQCLEAKPQIWLYRVEKYEEK
jgi:AmmeMemoRadiSam system protein B/AmmeMemoRadiSam system protein A